MPVACIFAVWNAFLLRPCLLFFSPLLVKLFAATYSLTSFLFVPLLPWCLLCVLCFTVCMPLGCIMHPALVYWLLHASLLQCDHSSLSALCHIRPITLVCSFAAQLTEVGLPSSRTAVVSSVWWECSSPETCPARKVVSSSGWTPSRSGAS